MSLIELLIAMAIALVVLAGVYSLFNAQNKNFTKETRQLNLRAKARLVMNDLVKELREAGAGLPPGVGIQTIAPGVLPSSITFRTNRSDTRTSLPVTGTGNTLNGIGDTVLTVVDGTGFSNGDVIYLAAPTAGVFEPLTVTGSTATTITVSTPLVNDYVEAEFGKIVTVNTYDTMTLTQTGNDLTKTVNGTNIPLASDVTINGLVFNYYGETDPSLVHVIGITLQMENPTDNTITFEIKTDVNVRNQ